MTDRWLGHFMDRFHELGLHENTVILLLSDHGYLLGERGYTGKVPLSSTPSWRRCRSSIAHPDGRAAGEVSQYFASTHDVGPTLLSMVGIDPPGLDGGHRPLPRSSTASSPPSRATSTTAACTTASSSAPTTGC